MFECTYTIRYNTKNPVPIPTVIEALTALNGLLVNVPKILGQVTETKIESGEFFIERIQSGSLTEDLLIKLFFKDEAELDAFMEKIRENGMLRNTIVGAVIGGLIVYGITLATGKNQTPNITATNNTIINIGAGEVKLTPEAFEAIVKAAVTDKQETAKNAVKFFAPARTDSESSVYLEGLNATQIHIPPATIAETPEKFSPIKNERTEDLTNTTVQIRAADLDSKKAGWAGKIEGKTDRIKIELDPNVKESDLFGKASVSADVTLIYTPKSKNNELSPSKIYIRKIHKT